MTELECHLHVGARLLPGELNLHSRAWHQTGGHQTGEKVHWQWIITRMTVTSAFSILY